MADLKIKRTILDADFISNMQVAREVAHHAMTQANLNGDFEQARYIKGIFRGIQIAVETYETCLNAGIELDKQEKEETQSKKQQSWIVDFS